MAQTDSVCRGNAIGTDSVSYWFKPLQLIVPGTLIGVGVIGLESDWLKFQNKEIRDGLQENIDHKLTVDDFTQYAPMAAAYGLSLCGVKGRHGYDNLTIILGTAYALMGSTVYAMKNITRVERPDGSAGIGILSVQAAYWIYPTVQKALFRKRHLKNTYIAPYLSDTGKGLSCTVTF